MQPSELDERILDEARLSLKYREPTTMRVDVTNAASHPVDEFRDVCHSSKYHGDGPR